jgi:hypothetical protein
VRAIDDVAQLLNLDSAHLARFHHDHVGMDAASDAAARRAFAARVAFEAFR